MKTPDENKIAAYIDGKLNKKEEEKMEKLISRNKKLQSLVLDILKTKREMKQGVLKELPWQLEAMIKENIDSMFVSKAKLILKLVKNGIQEVMSSLSGPKEAFNFNVRSAAGAVANGLHYKHEHEDINFDIFTYREDNDHLRIKLEITNHEGYSVNGNVTLKKSGSGLETKHLEDGIIEFDRITKGDYEFCLEYSDILSTANSSKKVHLFISLN